MIHGTSKGSIFMPIQGSLIAVLDALAQTAAKALQAAERAPTAWTSRCICDCRHMDSGQLLLSHKWAFGKKITKRVV